MRFIVSFGSWQHGQQTIVSGFSVLFYDFWGVFLECIGLFGHYRGFLPFPSFPVCRADLNNRNLFHVPAFKFNNIFVSLFN
jgi:hypothetical protein